MTRLSSQQIAAVSRASTVADTVAAISDIKGAPKQPVTAKAPRKAAAPPAPRPDVSKPDDGSDVLALVRAVGLPGFVRKGESASSDAWDFTKNVIANPLHKLVHVTLPEI